MKIAALGRTEYLYDAIEALHEAGHEIGCIITAPPAPEYARTEEDFAALAKRIGCPFMVTTSLDTPEAARLLEGLPLGVSVNWPTLIRSSVLDGFSIGVLNMHAGDLPKYRGNACPNWAILDGEKTITLSAHLMQGHGVDCGPVIAQQRLDIDDETYIAAINGWLLRSAPNLFREAVDQLDADPNFRIKEAQMDAPEAFRCHPRRPEDGFIDWSRPARDIHRLVRASSTPLPGAYTYFFDADRLVRLHVLRARIHAEESGPDRVVPGQLIGHDKNTGESLIACGQGILALTQCCEHGGEPFAPGGQWTSTRMRLGVRPEDALWMLQNTNPDSGR